MGNRSRYAGAAAIAAGAIGARRIVRGRRRARLGQALTDIADTIMPSVNDDLPATTPTRPDDEVHAGGHRHRPAPE